MSLHATRVNHACKKAEFPYPKYRVGESLSSGITRHPEPWISHAAAFAVLTVSTSTERPVLLTVRQRCNFAARYLGAFNLPAFFLLLPFRSSSTTGGSGGGCILGLREKMLRTIELTAKKKKSRLIGQQFPLRIGLLVCRAPTHEYAYGLQGFGNAELWAKPSVEVESSEERPGGAGSALCMKDT